MRWIEPPPPRVGDEKIVSWFAIRPVVLGREVRWLERVSVKMRFESCLLGPDWTWVEFVDPPKTKTDPNHEPVITQSNHTRKVELEDE